MDAASGCREWALRIDREPSCRGKVPGRFMYGRTGTRPGPFAPSGPSDPSGSPGLPDSSAPPDPSGSPALPTPSHSFPLLPAPPGSPGLSAPSAPPALSAPPRSSPLLPALPAARCADEIPQSAGFCEKIVSLYSLNPKNYVQMEIIDPQPTSGAASQTASTASASRPDAVKPDNYLAWATAACRSASWPSSMPRRWIPIGLPATMKPPGVPRKGPGRGRGSRSEWRLSAGSSTCSSCLSSRRRFRCPCSISD